MHVWQDGVGDGEVICLLHRFFYIVFANVSLFGVFAIVRQKIAQMICKFNKI